MKTKNVGASYIQCCVGISFTQIYLLGTNKVSYLSLLIFLKPIYPNQMHTQGYIKLKKYTCFITRYILKIPTLKVG